MNYFLSIMLTSIVSLTDFFINGVNSHNLVDVMILFTVTFIFVDGKYK